MDKETVVRQYFNCLEEGNYHEIIQLFSKEAIILSPLYGEKKPGDFYAELFADTNRSKITLKNIFISVSHQNIVSALFLYDW